MPRDRHHPPAPRRSPSPRALALVLVVALLAGLAPAALARNEQGEKIQISGLVTDPDGNPLADVTVVLEASRSVFSLRQLRAVERATTRVTAATDRQGHYTLSWPWDSYYNHFELVVGVPVRTARGEELQRLEQVDITRRLGRDSKVVVPLAVEARDADFLRHLRAFLATIDSADEERVYRELGKPDRVEIRGANESWWYFARGRRYDFEAGRLAEVKPFDPVPES
jgi:hypothetical protein